MVPRAPPHPSERGARRGRGPSPGSRRAPRGDGLPAHHSKMGSSWYRDLGEDTRGGPGCSQNDTCTCGESGDMPRSEAKKKEYNDTRKKKRHADKAKAKADAAAAPMPSEGRSSSDSVSRAEWEELMGMYDDTRKMNEWYADHYGQVEDKYEIAQKRVGQLTADLGQREMQLEDLQREYRLWIREWKDEKAELERDHKREIESWKQANITLAFLRGIPPGPNEGNMFTDPNGESPSSSPLRKKNSHGGDRVSAKWKAKKAAEVLALSSCSPKRKQRKNKK